MENKTIKINFGLNVYNPFFLSVLILGAIEPSGISEMARLFGGVWRYVHILFLMFTYFSYFFAAMVFLTTGKKKPDAFTVFVLLYMLWLTAVNMLNGFSMEEPVLYAIKIFSTLIILRYFMQTGHLREYVEVFNFWLVTFTLINIFTQVYYPNGLYTDDRNWVMWFFGNRNIFIFVYFMTILFNTLHNLMNYHKLRLSYFLLVGLIVFSEIKGGSATSTIAILVMVILITLFRSIKLSKFKICIISLATSITVSYIVINVGVGSFFTNLFKTLLDRSKDFTGRTEIWHSSVNVLKTNYKFGVGWTRIPLSWSWDIYQAHNCYLDILFTGGVVLAAIFLAIILISSKKIDLKEKNVFNAILAFLFVGYCIVYIMEARRKDVGIFILLAMMYYSGMVGDQININDEKETGKERVKH